MKVLLFVQNSWNGRPPRCVVSIRNPVRVNGEYFLSRDAEHRKRAADRWWLVECANAEAGRLAIKGYDSYVPRDGNPLRPLPCGRILASGGAR